MTLSSATDNARFGAVSNCPFIEFSLTIFDRWGGLMYTSQDPTQTWDGLMNGQLVSSGTYPYIVSVRYLEFDELIVEDYLGSITVIR
jgi:gliding motility-associated-like protein